MQFLVLGYDANDDSVLARRLAARDARIALGDRLRDTGKMHYSVTMLDEKGRMCGSLTVADFRDRAGLEEWFAGKPYVAGNVRQIG